MAITTRYTCDKCGTGQPTAEQFWSVGVVVEHGGEIIQYRMRTCEKQMHVCRPCLQLLGFYRESGPTPPALPAPPTLEELIREIARSQVSEMTGAT